MNIPFKKSLLALSLITLPLVGGSVWADERVVVQVYCPITTVVDHRPFIKATLFNTSESSTLKCTYEGNVTMEIPSPSGTRFQAIPATPPVYTMDENSNYSCEANWYACGVFYVNSAVNSESSSLGMGINPRLIATCLQNQRVTGPALQKVELEPKRITCKYNPVNNPNPESDEYINVQEGFNWSPATSTEFMGSPLTCTPSATVKCDFYAMPEPVVTAVVKGILGTSDEEAAAVNLNVGLTGFAKSNLGSTRFLKSSFRVNDNYKIGEIRMHYAFGTVQNLDEFTNDKVLSATLSTDHYVEGTFTALNVPTDASTINFFYTVTVYQKDPTTGTYGTTPITVRISKPNNLPLAINGPTTLTPYMEFKYPAQDGTAKTANLNLLKSGVEISNVASDMKWMGRESNGITATFGTLTSNPDQVINSEYTPGLITIITNLACPTSGCQ